MYRTKNGTIVKKLASYESNLYGTVLLVRLPDGSTTNIALYDLEEMNKQVKLL